MRSRQPLLRFAILTLLLALGCNAASAQSTAETISARLKGQPLYLRGCWAENNLKFDADGHPKEKYRVLPFTESGIDVSSVKISHGRLHIEGQRVGLLFANGAVQRTDIKSNDYSGLITIEIQAPSDGDFGKALDAIFAPDLASLVPTMPDYWQDYAREHLLPSGTKNSSDIPANASDIFAATTDGKVMHVAAQVRKPSVISGPSLIFSNAARILKISGTVKVYLWVMEDGSTSHFRVVQPVGMGLDEQAIVAVSQYKFRPATLDGKPVKVALYVDMNFQIF